MYVSAAYASKIYAVNIPLEWQITFLLYYRQKKLSVLGSWNLYSVDASATIEGHAVDVTVGDRCCSGDGCQGWSW